MRYSSILLLALLAACGDGSPVSVKLNVDKCALCRKAIVHKRNAGILKTADGKFELFDQISCLVSRSSQLGNAERVWVNDYWSEKWVDARKAYFVVDLSPGTMSSGYVATADLGDATKLGARNNEQPVEWAKMGGK